MTSYKAMSYSSLHHPVFPAQAHFQVFQPTQPPSRGPPQPQPSPSAPAAPTSFKAPAHKHAHHLHSIPPREKSTRTLIIDHMLWVHARTRFAQARAELGMTDRTGGPSSPHFRFRERPEQYDEEDEVPSDGEDVDQLKARGAGNGDDPQDEDARMQRQDFALARSLRLRAIALEKVVSSMLDQPPPLLHPVPPIGDETQSPPNSPRRREPQTPPKASHPHTLPNGVRLRLALGTVINDLFARQAPVAPYRHHHHPPPIVVSNSLSEKGSDSVSSDSSPVPPNLSPHPSIGTSQSSAPFTGVVPPSLLALASISGASGGQQYGFPASMSVPSVQGSRMMPGGQMVWNDRVRTLYMEGADPSTANSPPALRCPRHLHTGCEICVEARHLLKAPGGPAKGRPGAWGGEMTSRPPRIGSAQNIGGGGGSGITGWQDGSGIGSGLAHPGIHGSVLRRKSKWFQHDEEDVTYAGSGAGNTRLSELIPRFLRLSALVAMELGQELGDDEYQQEFQRDRSDGLRTGSPVIPQSPLQARKAQSESEPIPLRPSRDWYMLFGGLLTRAALEGYLTGGWRGPDAIACLLSVGLGMSNDPPSEEEEADLTFEWFDPDELPTLKEAAQIMFPSLAATVSGVTPRKENAEAEFAAEMKERLRRFYAIPPLTPDLSTHMEDLAWHFPAESVERAALRFCEAVAQWRGKPELETYKKRSKDPATPAMTIESLVHSNPTSPTSGAFSIQPSFPKSKRPAIEQYFVVPQSLTGRKRRRSGDDVDRFTKRVHGGVPVPVASSHT